MPSLQISLFLLLITISVAYAYDTFNIKDVLGRIDKLGDRNADPRLEEIMRAREQVKREERIEKKRGEGLRDEYDGRKEFIDGEVTMTTHRESRGGRTSRTDPSKAHHARIVGGSTASEDDYPWMVSLQQTWGHFCGGSLISNQWVLTAAHCVVGGEDFFVEVGRYHLGNESEAVFHRVQVDEVHAHVCYDGSSDMSYDVALVKMSEPVNNPIIDLFSGVEADIFNPGVSFASIAGWGNMEVAPFWPEHLQHVTVPTITNDECKAAYGSSSITGAMVCAGDVDDGGVDSCQGDSGGPMFVHRSGKYIQVGVVSWGIGCADPGYPGVYADVASVHDWIIGYVAGTDMNEVERNADESCPLRSDPGLPTVVEDDWDWDWVDTDTYNNTDCDGVLFSDSYLWWVGDCYCDGTNSSYQLNLNCSQWNWDGGDCNSDVHFGSSSCAGTGTPYEPPSAECENFSCVDNITCVDAYVLDYAWVADGICDLILNCSQYDLDGGDCATSPSSSESDDGDSGCENFACENYDSTICVDQYLGWDWIGDNYCDYALFCQKYEFDGGDCDNADYSQYYSYDYTPGSYTYDSGDGECSNYACSTYYDPTACVDQYISWNWIGDGYCDSALNCEEHNFDGSDCEDSSSVETGCGCEDGTNFCNYDYGYTGFCEPCSNHFSINGCYDVGLPEAGAQDCENRCFGDGNDGSSSGQACEVSRIVSQKFECSSDGISMKVWHGSLCSDTDGLIESYESNNYIPHPDGYMELDLCFKVTDLFNDFEESFLFGVSADLLYATLDCGSGSLDLEVYFNEGCNTLAGSTSLPSGICNSNENCASDRDIDDNMSQVGMFISGECTSDSDSYTLHSYSTNSQCLNDQGKLGSTQVFER